MHLSFYGLGTFPQIQGGLNGTHLFSFGFAFISLVCFEQEKNACCLGPLVFEVTFLFYKKLGPPESPVLYERF